MCPDLYQVILLFVFAQKGLGDKAINQLEKSVSAKLESSLSRQIQMQFQTSGKQALQVSTAST